MSKCCDATCFDNTYDKCIESTVPDIAEISYEQGDSLDSFNKKLADQVIENKKSIEDCSFCGGESEGSQTRAISNTAPSSFQQLSTTGSNTCISKITPKFTVQLSPGNTSVSLFYDLAMLQNSLPSGEYKVLGTQVKIKDNANNVIYSGAATASAANIAPSKFPVSLSVGTRVSSPCGDITLSRNMELEGSARNGGTFNFNIDKSPTEEITNQGDFNSMVASKMQRLEASQNSDNFTIIGCNNSRIEGGSYNELIQKLFNKICNLEKELEEIKGEGVGSYVTSDELTSLESKVNSLQNTVNINTQNISSIS